jgi:hypothetical protein
MADVAVIVPTVLGLGLLFTLATLARDAYLRARGPGWMSRRCGIDGRASALWAAAGLGPAGSVGEDLEGRRSRRAYRAWGVALSALSGYLALGSFGNFIGWTFWAENVSWLWLVFLAFAAFFGFLGVAALTLAAQWDHAPDWIRPVLARTPLGRVPDRRSVQEVVIAHPGHTRRKHRPAPVRPLGPQHVTDRVALGARVLASGWSVVAVAVLGWLTVRGAIPATPEELDSAIATPAWIALAVLVALSAVAVYRWELGGAVALAVAAALLGLMSSIQYPAPVALLVAGVFAVPAFLHWLAWQRDHRIHHLVRVAALTSLLLVGVWTGSDRIYLYFFGPTHPESVAEPLPDSPVVWAWTGGTTARSTTVVARVRGDDEGEAIPVRLAVSADPGLAAPMWSPPVAATAAGQRVARLTVGGLRPGTRYHWAVEVDGVLDRVRTGSFETMPEGPASFTLVAAACARSGSNGGVFDAIREAGPLAYLQIGDLNYANIRVDDPGRFREAYQQLLTAPGQAALYRSTSIAYVWDDHDFGANDSDASSPSRAAAGAVYRAWVPYHPLVSDQPTGAIGQSFVAGRVRVVMTDTRSQRTPKGAETGPAQQVMGAQQEAWFAAELAAAREAGQVVVWTGGIPWIGPAEPSDDAWSGYADARRRTADLIAAAGMQNRLVLVAGDAHMVALDDGSHSDYSTAQAGGFPVLQAAALDRPGSQKGGPYSGGAFPGGGQYGEVSVRDDGGPALAVTLRGRTWDGRTLVEQTFTLPVG